MKCPNGLIFVMVIGSFFCSVESLLGTPLPKPTGPYAVGSRYLYLLDKDRPDLISPAPRDFRAVSLQVWYPAEPGPDNQPILLNDRKLIEGYVQEGAFDSAILSEWAMEPTHSFLNARPAKTETPFPVILYSASGVINANTFLSEELASHGYVVFAIGHPYWCEFYFDAEGKTTPLDKNNEYYKQLWKEEGSWQVQKIKKEITLAKTLEEQPDLYKQLNQAMPTEVSDLRLWGEDLAFVVEQLKEMNSQTGFFKGIMDVNRIGVMGYSKGGAAAGQYCLTADDRCKAGINLGGFMFADIVNKNLKKPFLIMEHIEPWAPDSRPIGELFIERAEGSAYMVAVRDALHGNFCDITLAKKYIKPEGIVGSINGEKFLHIMEYYVLAFFDKYVKEIPGSAIKDLSTTYPEVIFKARNERIAKNGSPPPFDVRLQNVREKVTRLINEGKAASLSIAVAKDGKILWEESFGWADREKQVRATPHTKYLSASIAKTITATGLMTLVEKGLVDLDKPILDYVPQLKIRSFVGEEKEISVRHVLNHRWGMPSYCELFFEDDPEESRDFLETVRRYGMIAFPPGGSFIYNNLGYAMIAYLISEVSGMDYVPYIENKVLLPLGMTDSKVLARWRAMDQAAICYAPGFHPIPRHWGPYPGADGIYISAHDLIRFAMFHLKDHPRDPKAILSAATIDKMQEAYPPSNTRYGIGWYFDVNEAGYRSVYHGGEGPGSDNFMRLIPSEDMALVILGNMEISDHLGEIQEEICSALIPGFAKARKEDPSSQEPADEQKIPAGLLGRWKGKIVAYDREVEAELKVDETEGATIALSGQPESKMDLAFATDDFLLGCFSGAIPTPDANRHPADKVRLALVRRGNRLSGSATADQWVEERQVRYELSSWIELKKK